jgi:hypothetical protein
MQAQILLSGFKGYQLQVFIYGLNVQGKILPRDWELPAFTGLDKLGIQILGELLKKNFPGI